MTASVPVKELNVEMEKALPGFAVCFPGKCLVLHNCHLQAFLCADTELYMAYMVFEFIFPESRVIFSSV